MRNAFCDKEAKEKEVHATRLIVPRSNLEKQPGDGRYGSNRSP
jgi:hypothetical protein